ncbi:cytochrome P450 family monooxygenase (macronuclear) [Tetrahymena thermophila SB210]|uniref:Cytochrome P450 family monooxygenase n=1 Tax=Tetrahymena thermophila (strain SB210) TaxID=312017 RepID=Q22NL5_TETTS|nr:cytochrome P450 family monooxygenase [Tetrahymena thermophila SB210]EAR86770.2 cytochrome P450 family monooxygenase [Tetrahymena thermophila SB210]|eukprot:XP_001007015.2 cytochrome P450 family monooxygenase [Tetrahymena thermophila SB210]
MQVVEKRRIELIEVIKSAKNNFLHQYLKEMIVNEKSKISNEEIIDNFLALFFAGTDTTGNMTRVALYYLSLYPDIQNKAREEIIKLASSRTKSTNPVDLFNSLTFEDIQNLNFLNSVLKESLRLIPPAIEVFPRVAIQDIQIGDFEVKKGDFINTFFIYNFSNPEIYPEPNNFDPSRWMKQIDQQNTFNFTPFSLGPRNCIGQHLAMIEGKSMLAYILLNFEIFPNKNQEVVKEMKIIYGFQKDNLVYFKNRSQ